jgi:cell division septation protein DedD
MPRKGREQFQFTVLELTTLAISFAATSALVFLLGFYVGREAAAEHAAVGDGVARVPVLGPPGETEAAAKQPVSVASKLPAKPAATVAPLPHVTAALAPTPPPAAAAPGAEQPSSPPPLPPPSADVLRAPPGVPFTVQILATRNHGEADALVNDLKRQGYGAYLVTVEDAGGTWYRVRVGHFENAEAAKRMADRAQRELGLTQAYVSPIYSNAR